jgi:hypothetical protein
MDIVVEEFYRNFQERTRNKIIDKKNRGDDMYSNKIILLMNTKIE